MSYPVGPGYYAAEAKYADLLKSIGLTDALSVFEHPKIHVWRSIRERENCVLDHDAGRLHIKRNKPGYRGVETEVEGIRLLQKAGIKTVPLAAHGMLHDGRGFLITDDLAGYEDSEKLAAGGTDFNRLLEPTARLAGRLHGAKLHHRDLYLCHFYADIETDPVDLVLMDAGRVKKLPRFFQRRWLVKDVAQFVYSLKKLEIDARTIDRWFGEYARHCDHPITDLFKRAVFSKADSIARHDAALRRKDPNRNVSINR